MNDLQLDIVYFTTKGTIWVLFGFYKSGRKAILKHTIFYLGGAWFAMSGIGLCGFALLINLLICIILFLLSVDAD